MGDLNGHSLLQVPGLHENVIAALMLVGEAIELRHFLYTVIHVYADGSARSAVNGRGAGWGMIILGERPGTRCPSETVFDVLGHTGGTVPAFASSVLDSDPVSLSNEAEATALLYAVAWYFQFMPVIREHNIKCEIHSDSATIACWSEALRTSDTHSRVVKACQALWQCALHSCEIVIKHVSAHVGQPWNEAADSVAKAAASEGYARQDIDATSPLARFVEHAFGQSQWAFLECMPPCLRNAYPPMVDGAFVIHDQGTYDSHVPMFSASVIKQRHDRTHRPMNLRMLSANVLSLDVSEASDSESVPRGTNLIGRGAHLRSQMLSHGIDLAGIQEARSPVPTKFIADGYVVIAGGATPMRSHGCELWVACKLHDSKHEPSSTTRGEDCLVLHADPRRIIVMVHSVSIHVLAVVLHAPHEGSTTSFTHWWLESAKLVHSCQRDSVPIIVFTDANAGVGEVTSTHIGPRNPRAQNKTGSAFHEFLISCNLWAPATFSHCARPGCDNTFFTSTGKGLRSDFVLLPVAWKQYGVEAWVEQNIDLAITRCDHKPTAVAVMNPHIAGNARFRRRSVKYDKNKIGDPECQQRFVSALSQIQHPPWSCDVHTHAHAIQKQIKAAAEASFPLATRAQRKHWISHGSWALLEQRSECRKAIKYWTHVLRWFTLVEYFRRWSHVPCSEHRLAFMCVSIPPLTCSESRQVSHARFCTAFLHRTVDSLHAPIVSSLRHDRCQRTKNIIEQASVLCAQGRSEAIYACIKALKPAPKTGIHSVKLSDGSRADSYHRVRERWQEHFAGIQDGRIVTSGELWSHTRDTLFGRSKALPHEIPPTAVPTIVETVSAFHNVKTGRAAGEDTILPELVHCFPQLLAQCCHPIMLKASLRAEEPLLWRGGMNVELFKGRDDPAVCSNSRAVLIEYIIAKAYHRIIRRKVLPFYEAYCRATQCGGIRGRATDIAAHTVRAFAEWAHVRKLSHGVFFSMS